ncbi:hypothetical protein D7V93_04765 [Corallococcus llansteffanensis]|uniref:Uncharacterized protein n=1 Tax=Corallococcus llansteffanensis TaxID=2316731 RepID=A0A3A8QSP0_9BACT|nr:hypothetical protein D7V93_04765 [Corallococcus llansteffanensis]
MLLAALCSAEALARAPATLEDLQALGSQKAWAELLERAEDVAPAARSDAWRALVTDAAVAQAAAGTSDDKDPFAATRKARTLGQRYAFLAQTPRFATARDEVARKDLEHCLDLDRDKCLDTYLELNPDVGSEGALQAARAVRKGHHAYVPMPLFAAAVGGKKDAGACKDDGLAETVVAALGLPATDPRAVSAKKVAFDACWSALGPKLKAAMVGASSYHLANTCQPMRAHKALTEMQEDLCKDEGL